MKCIDKTFWHSSLTLKDSFLSIEFHSRPVDDNRVLTRVLILHLHLWIISVERNLNFSDYSECLIWKKLLVRERYVPVRWWRWQLVTDMNTGQQSALHLSPLLSTRSHLQSSNQGRLRGKLSDYNLIKISSFQTIIVLFLPIFQAVLLKS